MQLLLLSAESTNLEVCLIHGARPRHLVGVGIQGGHQKVGETHIHRVRTLPAVPDAKLVQHTFSTIVLRGADISRVHADLRDIRGENLQTGATGTTRRTEFDAGQSWVFAFGCYGSAYGARTDPRRPPKYSPPSATTAMARPQHLYLSNVLLGRWVDAAAYRRRNKVLTAPVDVSGCERHLRKTLAFPDTDINWA